ncbi:MAG: hypothetical protein ACRECH_09150 [Nitrososphaerales archaeon]
MVAKTATVGIVILLIGLIIGVYAVYTPVSTTGSVSSTLLNTSLKIDANDYESHNTPLSQGQAVSITVSITNQTIFNFYVMNQSQYYTFYSCAPLCHTAPNGSVAGPISPPSNLAAQVNVTVTPTSSYSSSFTAPASGTYYFVFDNTVGPSWATYYNQNASSVVCNTPKPFLCNTVGSFKLVGNVPQTNYSVNWAILGAGIVLLIVGGAIATAGWGTKPRRKTPPITTTAVPPASPSMST